MFFRGHPYIDSTTVLSDSKPRCACAPRFNKQEAQAVLCSKRTFGGSLHFNKAMASNIANIGGYDCDFVEPPPDSLLCLICTFVAREPMQMDCCGKVYCEACLTEHKKSSNKCPNCREEGNGFKDRKSEREVKALKVKCGNLKNGCPWVGELAALDEHHDTCDHALLPCPNQCKVEDKVVQLLRKDIETHCRNKCLNRSYQCPHCREEGKHCDITTSHLKTCPKVMICCPNGGCGEEVIRCSMSLHQTTCPFEVVPCKYAKIGCRDRALRKEVSGHEEDYQLHLHVAMDTILKAEDNISRLQTRVSDLETRNAKNFATPSSLFIFRMSAFNQYKESKAEFYSPPFYSHQGGYKMCLGVVANGCGDGEGTHVSVFTHLMRGENDDTLTWPFTGTITVELLNQLEDKEHHQDTTPYPEGMDDECNRRVVDRERSIGWGCHQLISHSALGHRPAINCQYLKDDCLYFRVSVKTTKTWLACTV